LLGANGSSGGSRDIEKSDAAPAASNATQMIAYIVLFMFHARLIP
jgi:hypothetical protein